MKTVLVIGRRHGSKKLELVSVSNEGKEVGKISSDFKASCASEVNKTFELLELWSSDGGRRKFRKFITEVEAKRRSEPAQTPVSKPDPMKTIVKSIIAAALLFIGAASGHAQNIQYLLSNGVIPIGLSNVVTSTAVEGAEIGVGIDVKLTGAGTSGIAFVLEVSNDNTNWCTTPSQFWRAANGTTRVQHWTNFNVGAAPFARWTMHNTNSVAVTNSTVTQNCKKEYR